MRGAATTAQPAQDSEVLHELALFAGAGGGILGGILSGWRTVAAVEIDPFCREVLLRRQRDGMLPLFPIWDDARTFDGKSWRGIVDIITAGFPCQPFSAAGKRQGERDDRNMWPDTIRVIREVGPERVLLENVPGLLADPYFGTILGELAESGYDARWDCIPASALGAPHQRDRLWIVADARGERVRDESRGRSGKNWTNPAELEHNGPQESMADAESERSGASRAKSGESQGASGVGRSGEPMADAEDAHGRRTDKTDNAGRGDSKARRCGIGGARSQHWPVEPDMGRTFNGLAKKLD